MGKWQEIPISTKLFTNVNEAVLTRANAAVENAFINEAGGHTRFPGLRQFCALEGAAPTYLGEWEGDLIAESNSRVYRISRAGTVNDVTGVPVSGEGRTIFEETDAELVMAKGGPIVRLAGRKTELLSDAAPNATHVGYVDRYLLANETHTFFFQHSQAGSYREWDALDTFAADGKPDDITALIVTPYREVILAGPKSVEQFDRLPSGTTPFFRRWSVGEGIHAPYTLIAEDQGIWGVNNRQEFVRFTGQQSEPNSDDIGRSLEAVDNWTLAWAQSMNVLGQKFIVLQAPFATNIYGTKGVTMLLDYRAKKWSSLYGWDVKAISPTRWPGWSYYKIWGRNFVGGNGKVFELTDAVHTNDGVNQRMLGRSAPIDKWGESRVENVQVRVRRGQGSNDVAPRFGLRVFKDNKKWTRWVKKSLGPAGSSDMVLDFGPMGWARTFQFEWACSDDCEMELVSMRAMVTGV